MGRGMACEQCTCDALFTYNTHTQCFGMPDSGSSWQQRASTSGTRSGGKNASSWCQITWLGLGLG